MNCVFVYRVLLFRLTIYRKMMNVQEHQIVDSLLEEINDAENLLLSPEYVNLSISDCEDKNNDHYSTSEYSADEKDSDENIGAFNIYFQV